MTWESDNPERLSNLELAKKLTWWADFIKKEVSGQRYGQFGSPFVDVRPMLEAAKRLEKLP